MVGKPGIVDILDTALRASAVRQKVIANNLANLNTPGFRRNSVRFEEILADAMDSAGGISRENLMKIEGQVLQPKNTPVKNNGNDVNLDIEVGEMLKNSSRHKTYVRLLNKRYGQMELAMRDRM